MKDITKNSGDFKILILRYFYANKLENLDEIGNTWREYNISKVTFKTKT